MKLRLLGPEAHDALAAALQPHYRETHEQENTFFDGAKRELSSQRTVVRCRFYNVDKRALLTIKVSTAQALTVLCSSPSEGSSRLSILHRVSKSSSTASDVAQRLKRMLTRSMHGPF